MIKVCFFDIDGTLLSHKTGQVPASTTRALRQLREKGIKTVISTGRSLEEMVKLPILEVPFDAYLTLNGKISTCHSNKSIDERIYKSGTGIDQR